MIMSFVGGRHIERRGGNMNLPAITEKQFMRQVIQLAKLRQWAVYHTFDSRRSQAGFPDLVLARDRILWIELKTEKGKLTPAQEEWIACLKKAGQEVYVFRPSMWGQIEDVLR